MPVTVASRKEMMSLWHFFFGELGTQLLLLSFAQPALFTHDRWHLRCLHAKVCHWNLGPFLVMTRHSRGTRRLRWLWRSRRCLRKSCQRQQRDNCNGEYGIYFHGFVLLSH